MTMIILLRCTFYMEKEWGRWLIRRKGSSLLLVFIAERWVHLSNSGKLILSLPVFSICHLCGGGIVLVESRVESWSLASYMVIDC